MTFHQAKINILINIMHGVLIQELNYKIPPLRRIDLVAIAYYVEETSCLFLVLYK